MQVDHHRSVYFRPKIEELGVCGMKMEFPKKKNSRGAFQIQNLAKVRTQKKLFSTG